MVYQINDAAVIINGTNVALEVNTVSFTEGEGEQSYRALSTGGGGVIANKVANLESKFPKVMMSLPCDKNSVDLARSWKQNFGRNEIQISGISPDGQIFNRVFIGASITNDYEVPLSAEGTIDLEWMAEAVI